MAKLTVYRQKRYDGGVRTGIDLDDQTLAETFEEGAEERDPALLWFVDLRCEGPGVPDDTDEAEGWLVNRSPTIREALRRYADKLRVGADRDDYVLKWTDFPDAPADVEMAIVGSAARRIDARSFAAILDDVAGHWDERIDALLAESHTA